jgi:glycosyltransferase involved in cell wall biosynthesis
MTAATGVRDGRSLGITRYVARLADALRELGVVYAPAEAPVRDALSHFHLGNSSRRAARQAAFERRPSLLTIHDVVPRTRALAALYRAAVYPLAVRRAARVVVHSGFAADLLVHEARVNPRAVEVVPHPATAFAAVDREEARRALSLAGDAPLFVLPGVIKRAKLVAEAVEAAAPLLAAGKLRLLLAGPVADRGAAKAAVAAGAVVLDAPEDETYAHALAAADCVLVLRSRSVGETNGPLLDAIGAGRAVLACEVGSIPEVAAGCARLVARDCLRAGLEELLCRSTRAELACRAAARARELTWAASAARHAELLEGLAA